MTVVGQKNICVRNKISICRNRTSKSFKIGQRITFFIAKMNFE